MLPCKIISLKKNDKYIKRISKRCKGKMQKFKIKCIWNIKLPCKETQQFLTLY